MSKEELMSFLVRRGDAYKQDQYRFTYNVTKDGEDLAAMTQSLKQRIQIKHRKL
jgi:predicted transcriptional regulator